MCFSPNPSVLQSRSFNPSVLQSSNPSILCISVQVLQSFSPTYFSPNPSILHSFSLQSPVLSISVQILQSLSRSYFIPTPSVGVIYQRLDNERQPSQRCSAFCAFHSRSRHLSVNGSEAKVGAYAIAARVDGAYLRRISPPPPFYLLEHRKQLKGIQKERK